MTDIRNKYTLDLGNILPKSIQGCDPIKNITDLSNIEDQQFIFGSLFAVANKLQTELDKSLKEFNMTAKQLYLAISISSLFDESPTLKETANAIGYSHQNIKQIALKLESKGFLKIKKDEIDARVLRLVLTDKINIFWQASENSGSKFLDDIFRGIEEKELKIFRKTIATLLLNLYEMDKKL